MWLTCTNEDGEKQLVNMDLITLVREGACGSRINTVALTADRDTKFFFKEPLEFFEKALTPPATPVD